MELAVKSKQTLMFTAKQSQNVGLLHLHEASFAQNGRVHKAHVVQERKTKLAKANKARM